jgi:hypothetical protein
MDVIKDKTVAPPDRIANSKIRFFMMSSPVKQAGAQSVSQPPAPDSPLPVMGHPARNVNE